MAIIEGGKRHGAVHHQFGGHDGGSLVVDE
jgi:hypothetical protein